MDSVPLIVIGDGGGDSTTKEEEEEENSKDEDEDEQQQQEHQQQDIHDHQPPSISHLQLFTKFLIFGLMAWGGPFAQINMIKEALVLKEKWITMKHFNRVLAVYQALPGPEATELCCYFGMIAKGRVGSVIAGVGFILPGFILMLFFSWLYVSFGLENIHFQAVFKSIQPSVTAMVFRATHKISETAFMKNETLDHFLFLISMLGVLQATIGTNFFITLAFCGILAIFLDKKTVAYYVIAAGFTAIVFIGLGCYLWFFSSSGGTSMGNGIVGSNAPWGIFALGLLSGLLTFGGAYTAIPFIQADAVFKGHWMTSAQFLDGIALASVLPAPLVIFSTFVGYIGGGFLGAFLMTIGIFLPAFLFTLIGHNLFEKIVKWHRLSVFLDGITAGVVGLIMVTAFQLLKSTIKDTLAGIIFLMTLASLYYFQKNKYAPLVVLFLVACAGATLYVD